MAEQFLSEKQQTQELKEHLKKVRRLSIRDNSYFNDRDYFIFKNSLNQIFSLRLHRNESNENGSWYGGNYKMTSVPSINSKELI